MIKAEKLYLKYPDYIFDFGDVNSEFSVSPAVQNLKLVVLMKVR